MALVPVSWVGVSQRLAISNQSWELAGGRVCVGAGVGMRGGEGKKMGESCSGTREAVAWSPPTPRWLSLLSFPDPGEDHDTKTLLREPV